MDQAQAPLWEAIIAYANRGVIPFHTPGHKLRSGVFPHITEILGTSLWSLDASDEVEHKPSNHNFKYVLQRAEALASQLFNSSAARYLVNGTSGGIHAMLLGVRGEVLIPRFSHQSVYGGLALSGAEPVYLGTRIDPEWNIPLPPSADEIGAALRGRPGVESVVLTHPTYYGTTTDLENILALKNRYPLAVYVDEAHGSHFRFSQDLPQSAVDLKADAIVHSTHKTLGTLTQSSILHINNPQIVDRIDRALTILQSTSPSLILLGVLDAVRREMALNGEKLVHKAVELGKYARDRLNKIGGVRVAPEKFTKDPTKLVFSLSEIGLTGLEVEARLRRDFNIQVELSDYYNVLALITLGDCEQTVEVLLAAIGALAEKFKDGKPLARQPLAYGDLVPQKALSLREALGLPSEVVAPADAGNRIAADFLVPYPPGVPVVVPGEIISPDLIAQLRSGQGQGWEIRGMTTAGVRVICQS